MADETKALQLFLGYWQGANTILLRTLIKCLEANGSLKSGQFEAALQATIDQPGAESGRPDYQMLATFLKALQDEDAPKMH